MSQVTLDALECAAREYSEACEQQPFTSICSGEYGRIRELQLQEIEQRKRNKLEVLGRAAQAHAKAGSGMIRSKYPY